MCDIVHGKWLSLQRTIEVVLAWRGKVSFTGGKDMFSALDITYKTIVIIKADPNLADNLTPLKLQKLLFYMQGWYAGNYKTRLFSDDICAWKLGPVVESVYHAFQQYGSQNLLEQTLPEHTATNTEERNIDDDIKDVLRVYGRMSAFELVERTHREDIWRKNFDSSNKVIPFEEIRKAFESKLVGAAAQ